MKPKQGQTIWITGLSGAGKSTLARALSERLRARQQSLILLDGDELREVFSTATSIDVAARNHDRAARLTLAMQYARLCHVLSAQGHTVIIATISLFREVHQWNREHLANYYEVYLKVPLAELRRRDPKGIYQRFDAGELNHVAGLDVDIDEPEAADWVIEHSPETTLESIAAGLLARLEAPAGIAAMHTGPQA